jgi:hypothetical protein
MHDNDEFWMTVPYATAGEGVSSDGKGRRVNSLEGRVLN